VCPWFEPRSRSQILKALQKCGAFSILASNDEFKNDSGARHDRFKAVLAVQEPRGIPVDLN